jgi:hypothetical protein
MSMAYTNLQKATMPTRESLHIVSFEGHKNEYYNVSPANYTFSHSETQRVYRHFWLQDIISLDATTKTQHGDKY